MMDEACDDVLAYTVYPKEHWPQIASTNPLERLNREIKRRANDELVTASPRTRT